jgi:menaquinone-9 beta-reductase
VGIPLGRSAAVRGNLRRDMSTRAIKRVIVVGAGPAGAACATTLKRLGVPEVEILERRREMNDKPCAGGLSPRALEVLGRFGLDSKIQQGAVPIRGARLVGPDGRDLMLRIPGKVAVVMRRTLFDSMLLDWAEKLGVVVSWGVAIDRLIRRDGVVVGAGAGPVEREADAVVIATGAREGLVEDPRPRQKVDAVIARYEGYKGPPDVLHFAFNTRTLPHYAWIFPEPNGGANVGLAQEPGRDRPPLHETLEAIIAECFPQLEGAHQVGRVRGHPIVYSATARHLVEPGVVRVGEAARLTDAFTGEGIWHALRSGVEAGKAIAEGDLKAYERRARLVFDPPLLMGEATRRLGASKAFWRFFIVSPWKPVAWLTGRVLIGIGG